MKYLCAGVLEDVQVAISATSSIVVRLFVFSLAAPFPLPFLPPFNFLLLEFARAFAALLVALAGPLRNPLATTASILAIASAESSLSFCLFLLLDRPSAQSFQ